MNIHAISYTNIGPFHGTRSVIFQSGKYLIQAPIGSGKSFLFFDGPIFALYKYSSRPLLNKNSTSGNISILFSVESDYYLITRDVTHGKSKDKVQSRFFRVELGASFSVDSFSTNSTGEGEENVFMHTNYIQSLIDSQQIVLDEIVFKSDTELQKTVESLIPPRKVITSTQFLLQDSDNFFATTPADRITVFKNIFNLMSIDDAKTVITDHKKELQTRIRVMQDTHESDTHLQKLMNQLINGYDVIKPTFPLARCDDIQRIHSTANNKRGVRDFDTRILDISSISSLHSQQSDKLQELHSKQTILTQLRKRSSDDEMTTKRLQSEQVSLQKNIEALTKTLNTKGGEIDINQEREKLITQQQSLLDNFNRELITKELQSYAEKYNTDFTYFLSSQSLHTLQRVVDQLTNQGASLRTKLDTNNKRLQEQQAQLQSLKKSLPEISSKKSTDGLAEAIAKQKSIIQQQHDAIVAQRKSMDESKTSHQQQIKDLTARIRLIEQDLSTAKRFPCAKINADCPFIEQIASASLSKFTKQIDLLKQQKEKLVSSFDLTKRQSQYDKLVTQYQDTKKQMELLHSDPKQVIPDFFVQQEKQVTLIQQQIDDITSKIKKEDVHTHNTNIQEQIDHIASLLTTIHRKKLSLSVQKRTEYEHHIKQLDAQSRELETKRQKRAEQEKLLIKYQTQLSTIKDQLTELEKDRIENDKQIEVLQSQVSPEYMKQAQIYLDTLQMMKQNIERIIELIETTTSKQQQLKQIQLKEQRVKNLHNIFSKELMYVVLEDTLPVLFDIINTYLAQVVTYTIHFELIKSASDKLELEVTVRDDKGERTVDSLSGGQKVVLKLVRILAIVSYTRGGALFLDETINNLDRETVSKVATMLEDFVRSHDIKLYVVTHSPQIQQMSIRDQVVKID